MLAVLFVAGMGGWAGFEVIRNVTFAALGLAPLAFLLGLVDARLARADIGGLLVELRADPTADLRPPLARALHDPSLRAGLLAAAVRRPGPTRRAGRSRCPSWTTAGRAASSTRDGEPMAALVHDPSLEEEPELLDAVTAAAAIALENGRLRAELRARLEELRGSRARVLEAGQQERQRLERDLHDGAQQRLVALSLDLGCCSTRLGDDPEAQALLAEAKRRDRGVAGRAARRGARPAPGRAQRARAGGGAGVAGRAGARPGAAGRRLDGPARRAGRGGRVLRGLREPGQHRQARAGHAGTVERRRVDGDTLVVEVVDDGRGGADTERGTGLRGLADRVEALGGRLRVWTPLRPAAPGYGRRSRAGSHRRGQRAAARGPGPAADRRRFRGGRPRAATPTSCARELRVPLPDVAIVDIRLPPTHTDEGLRAAIEIRRRYPRWRCWCCPSTSSWAWP